MQYGNETAHPAGWGANMQYGNETAHPAGWGANMQYGNETAHPAGRGAEWAQVQLGGEGDVLAVLPQMSAMLQEPLEMEVEHHRRALH